MKPVETAVKPRFSNRKVEPNLDRETRRVEYSFETSKSDNFAWLICRRKSGSLKTQKVPTWTGWLSQTITDIKRTISTVEYMALLSENINEKEF